MSKSIPPRNANIFEGVSRRRFISTTSAIALLSGGFVASCKPNRTIENASGFEAAKVYYVSNSKGNDGFPGTKNQPFKTIQKAADIISPGEICRIRAGRYRETVIVKNSGLLDLPIIFEAERGEEVILDGTDVVTESWRKSGTGKYKTSLSSAADQVFYRGVPMTLARWPKMNFHDNWIEDKKWARTGPNSIRGQIDSPELGALGASLAGATLYIKLGKGNNCFGRKITQHEAGRAELTWDDTDFYDNRKSTAEDGLSARIKAKGLANNRFFINDHPALLTAPGEWYCDPATSELSVIPKDGATPDKDDIAVKRRTSGFSGGGVDNIAIKGLTFFACSVHFELCRSINIEDCVFEHPYALRRLYDNRQIRAEQRPPYCNGDNATFLNCLVRYAPGPSLLVRGRGHRIENCVFTEGSRNGRHNDPSVIVEYTNDKRYNSRSHPDILSGKTVWTHDSSKKNLIERCSVFQASGPGIYLLGRGPSTARYNHVFNIGMYCTDVSALYIPSGNNRAWSGFNHNWLHDVNGIGLRCDQNGTDVLFHHNVVWNCKAGGKANGFTIRVFNNTFFVDNPRHPFLLVKQGQIDVVDDWPVQNNVVYRLLDRMDLREWRKMNKEQRAVRPFVIDVPDTDTIHHNHIISPSEETTLFKSVDNDLIDLRPAAASPLIDAGVAVPGITDGFIGAAPDIGAYEYGGENWIAGADWWPDDKLPPLSMTEATQRARRLSKGALLFNTNKEAYKNQ